MIVVAKVVAAIHQEDPDLFRASQHQKQQQLANEKTIIIPIVSQGATGSDNNYNSCFHLDYRMFSLVLQVLRRQNSSILCA